jgi:2-keto-3-deoxy-L-rhamnonate aldolase RhmA
MGIVEEPHGVENLKDILREVKGIGAVWAGPGDMSVAMGHRGNAGHPDVQANLLRILETCQEAGVPCATGATDAEVPMRLEQGFRIIIVSPEKTTLGLEEGRRLAGR